MKTKLKSFLVENKFLLCSLVLLVFATAILFMSPMSVAKAWGSCRSASCGCGAHGIRGSCAKHDCWYDNPWSLCTGHNIVVDWTNDETWVGSGSGTCTDPWIYLTHTHCHGHCANCGRGAEWYGNTWQSNSVGNHQWYTQYNGAHGQTGWARYTRCSCCGASNGQQYYIQSASVTPGGAGSLWLSQVGWVNQGTAIYYNFVVNAGYHCLEVKANPSWVIGWQNWGLDGRTSAQYNYGVAANDWMLPVGYYAKNIYSITYNVNKPSSASSSVNGSNSSQSVYTHSAVSLRSGLSLNGWTFLGWSTNPNATTATYAPGQSVSNLSLQNGANVTLYAVWRQNVYYVKLDGNGANINNDHNTITCYYENTYNLWTLDTTSEGTANALRKNGYWFSYLTCSVNSTKYYSTSSFAKLTAINGATVTMTAQWASPGIMNDSDPDTPYISDPSGSPQLPSSTNALPSVSFSNTITYSGNGASTSSGDTYVTQSVSSNVLSDVTLLRNTFGTQVTENSYVDYTDGSDSSIDGNTTASRFCIPAGTWTYEKNGIPMSFQGWSLYSSARHSDDPPIVLRERTHISVNALIYMRRAIASLGIQTTDWYGRSTWTSGNVSSLLSKYQSLMSTISSYYSVSDLTLYAIWDEYPTISVENAYVYTSDIDDITPEYLLGLVNVSDHEDGDKNLSGMDVSYYDNMASVEYSVPNGTAHVGLFDYSASDFERAAKTQTSSVVGVTVVVQDSAGNTTIKTFNVTVINDTADNTDDSSSGNTDTNVGSGDNTGDVTNDSNSSSISEGDTVRFISSDTTDTLSSSSIWNTDSSYATTLFNVFSNLNSLIELTPTKPETTSSVSSSDKATSTWSYNITKILEHVKSAYAFDSDTIQDLKDTDLNTSANELWTLIEDHTLE